MIAPPKATPRAMKTEKIAAFFLTIFFCQKKGEHISINYSEPTWGTANRQLHLGAITITKK
jgi:hypothetical protein